MNHFDIDRVAELHRQLDSLLFYDWNPIGVPNVPETADEYSCYVRGVYDVAVETRSVEAVARLLLKIERESIGLVVFSGLRSRSKVAQKILDLIQGEGALP